MVNGYGFYSGRESVLAVNLPDPNDRHVVAAAIAGATVILAWNLPC
jgi:hypothetical protein